MKRFAALPVLPGALLVFVSAAMAEPLRKLARIGMLCNPICKVGFNDEFLDELNKLGWIEGKSIVIDRKDPGYQPDRIPLLAAELVQSKPDLIVTFTPQAARAAKEATSDIPIVVIFVADPVGMGLASSLPRIQGYPK